MKLIYEGTSSQTFIAVKSKLEYAGIPYRPSEKAKGGWLHLFFFFFTAASRSGYSSGRTGSPARNEERSVNYCIFVDEKDFEKAARLLLDSGISLM